ncbi:GNAT family N-acetyltransferase [Brevibacillus reuszeri]|uniref:GNAT family N-acetyltransferase n=2 Tax=Brevibacillus reuszeri TaxID=54915 RepID=A0ABQ0TSJ3_9BACL|nr:GNAT family N-acetyltransferase [Brevibacillus reuszeri]MED1860300.1 GNAT family N-acetyltransferase [Brevibacillus reuszeri]GED70811.1 GNAT family N-acetyltransferase [Brevibacillus reuszeri]
MSTMNNAGLVAAKGLSEEWLQQIIDLAEVCEAHDGFDLSINLNLSMLQNRSPEQTNDFLYFQDGKLVGFLGMYAIVSPKEVEISGMVHPDYRGKGIFRALYAQAKAECEKHGVMQILLVSNRQSKEASAFAEGVAATYQFSEYKLDYSTQASVTPVATDERLLLRPATNADFDTLVEIGVSGFGDSAELMTALVTRNLSESSFQTYLALYEARPVGMITVSEEDAALFISGFCVKKGLQGKGLGRKILSQTVEILNQREHTGISLEVAVDNQNALSLYQSTGFEVVSVYDYYVG